MVFNIRGGIRRRRLSKLTRRALAECWRVLLNGQDVTERTFYVDTRRGVVRVYAERSEVVIHDAGTWIDVLRRRARVFTGDVDEVVTLEIRGRVRTVRGYVGDVPKIYGAPALQAVEDSIAASKKAAAAWLSEKLSKSLGPVEYTVSFEDRPLLP